MAISDKMQAIADHFRMSDTKLGRIGEVNPQTIKNIRTGSVKNPQIGSLLKISNQLGINIKWLFEDEENMFPSPSSDCEEQIQELQDQLSLMKTKLEAMEKMNEALNLEIQILKRAK